MPTPTGLLKVGEHLRTAPDDTELVVTERLGNDSMYAVRVTRADGKPQPGKGSTWIITEVPYWLGQGALRLVTDTPEDAATVLEQLRYHQSLGAIVIAHEYAPGDTHAVAVDFKDGSPALRLTWAAARVACLALTAGRNAALFPGGA